MTCFWDSLRSKLNIRSDNISFISHLQHHNRETSVLWNDTPLKLMELQENYYHVKKYDTSTIHNGYLCAACDPFLLLISDLYRVQIYNNYNGHVMVYTPDVIEKVLHFHSSTTHFS